MSILLHILNAKMLQDAQSLVCKHPVLVHSGCCNKNTIDGVAETTFFSHSSGEQVV